MPVKSRDRAPVNLLELKPRRNVAWELGEDKRAVLLVPRFHNRLLRACLLPLLARPDIRVKLDATGTAFWQRCDGSTPILKIAEELATQSGSDVDEMLERLGRFLAKLDREGFVVVNPQADKQHRTW